MKKIVKKSFSLLLAVLLLTVFAASVYAVQPRYTTVSNVRLTITPTANGASCYCKIEGNSNVTSITDGVMELRDSSGTVVATWSNLSASGRQLTVTRTAANVSKGETYTLTITAYANTSTSSEYISEAVSGTC